MGCRHAISIRINSEKRLLKIRWALYLFLKRRSSLHVVFVKCLKLTYNRGEEFQVTQLKMRFFLDTQNHRVDLKFCFEQDFFYPCPPIFLVLLSNRKLKKTKYHICACIKNQSWWIQNKSLFYRLSFIFNFVPSFFREKTASACSIFFFSSSSSFGIDHWWLVVIVVVVQHLLTYIRFN